MTAPPTLSPLIGESLTMRRARELVAQYARSALPILLVGPTGTGKELLARHVHARSGRPGRFVPVNCGALPREMAEGLLFGHDRGAFSGAVKRHRGHVECAAEGTLFLDELLALPLEGQTTLLRTLDSGEFQRLGKEVAQQVDVRVVGAVQEDVEDRIARGAFRRDLYHRLAGVVIELSPLVERPEDIVPLARHFAAARGHVLGAGTPQILAEHGWRGNVRELRLVIERAACRVANGTLPPAVVREAITLGAARSRPEVPCGPQSPTHDGAERAYLILACRDHRWDTRRAAAALGISRATLYRKLRAYRVSLRALRVRSLHSEKSQRSLI